MASSILGAALALLPIPFFFISRDAFEGLLEKIVGAISVFRRLDSFGIGAFDWLALLVFAALAMSFFLLSFKALIANKTKKKKLSSGVKITAAITVCFLAISVVATILPSPPVPLDATQNNKLSVSDETKDFLKELDEDITIYIIDPTSSEDVLLVFLRRYASNSDRINVKVISSVTDGDVLERYGISPESVDAGSIILASETKHALLYAGDLFSYTNEQIGFSNIDSYTYAQYLYYAYAYDQASYEILQYETISLFNGDAVITTYVEYLTTDDMPTVFFLNGHGEAEPSDSCYFSRSCLPF